MNKKATLAAFRRAWMTLLKEERVTAENIERLPLELLRGILDAEALGERHEILLMAAGLEQVRISEGGQPLKHPDIPQVLVH